MTAIQLEDVSLLFAVALMHAYQLAGNAQRVGFYRRKYKISPPEMNGPPELIRALRAQQNDLEFAIPFQVLLWCCGVCLNQVVAAILGVVYIYFRRKYTAGYIEDAEKRVKPFHGSINVIKVMLVLCVAGIVSIWLKQFMQIDLAAMVKKRVYPLVGLKDEL